MSLRRKVEADQEAAAARCEQCWGCGGIASSDEGEPWSQWESLPPGSDLAVRMGLVTRIECPSCKGSGLPRHSVPRLSAPDLASPVQDAEPVLSEVQWVDVPETTRALVRMQLRAVASAFETVRAEPFESHASAYRAAARALLVDVPDAKRSKCPHCRGEIVYSVWVRK